MSAIRGSPAARRAAVGQLVGRRLAADGERRVARHARGTPRPALDALVAADEPDVAEAAGHARRPRVRREPPAVVAVQDRRERRRPRASA